MRVSTNPTSYTYRNIGSGRKGAAFWPKLGVPNLVLARAAKAKKREQRINLSGLRGEALQPLRDNG